MCHHTRSALCHGHAVRGSRLDAPRLGTFARDTRSHDVCPATNLTLLPPRHTVILTASLALDPAHPWRWFGRETRKTEVATYRGVVVSSRIRHRFRRGRRAGGARPTGNTHRGRRSRRVGLFGNLFGPELV